MMRIVEALEGKGYRLPLMKGEVELAEKLAAITRQASLPILLSSYFVFAILSSRVCTDKNIQMTVERIWSRTF